MCLLLLQPRRRPRHYCTCHRASLGWDVKPLGELEFSDLERVMGLESLPRFRIPSHAVKCQFPDIEFEHLDYLLLEFPNNSVKILIDYKVVSVEIAQFSLFEWKRSPDSPNKDHVCGDIIYKTTGIVKKMLTVVMGLSVNPFRSNESLFLGTLYKDLMPNGGGSGLES